MARRRLMIACVALAALATVPAHGHGEHHRQAPPASDARGPLDAAERARYAKVGRAVVEDLATGDLAAFRALHSDGGWDSSDAWWRSLLAPQRQRFGTIVEAWGPHRGTIRCGGFSFQEEGGGVTVVVRFQVQVGAALTFTLDPDGKIAGGKVFVSEGLASAPPEGLPVLWKRSDPR